MPQLKLLYVHHKYKFIKYIKFNSAEKSQFHNFSNRIFHLSFTMLLSQEPKNRARILHKVSSNLQPFFLSNSNKQKTQADLPEVLLF